MKEFSTILHLIADGYYEITKQAKMKDAMELGLDKLVSASKKIPAFLFVLFAPIFSYVLGTALIIYSVCRYFLTEAPDEAISLGVTGVVMIFIGAGIGFYFQKKINEITPDDVGETDFIPATKAGPVKDLLTQFSKEQNEIVENITSKFR